MALTPNTKAWKAVQPLLKKDLPPPSASHRGVMVTFTTPTPYDSDDRQWLMDGGYLSRYGYDSHNREILQYTPNPHLPESSPVQDSAACDSLIGQRHRGGRLRRPARR